MDHETHSPATPTPSQEPLEILLEIDAHSILLGLFFREQMEKRLTAFEMQLSRLHQRRAEAIAELYAHLVQVQTD